MFESFSDPQGWKPQVQRLIFSSVKLTLRSKKWYLLGEPGISQSIASQSGNASPQPRVPSCFVEMIRD